MGTLKKVTGTWRGAYRYDPSEGMAKRDPVAFTLTLKQGWFERFTGTVTDDSSGGMPGVGTIEGYFSYPRIEFTKQMPVFCVAAPDGRTISLREYLTELGHICVPDVPHTPVFYQGEFSSPNRAQGTWIVRAGPISLGGGRAIEMPETRGVWSIENGAA
jgi:hypothetical protein